MGTLIRQDADIDVEELDVETNEASEDIFAARLEYKGPTNKDVVISVICYMTWDTVVQR